MDKVKVYIILIISKYPMRLLKAVTYVWIPHFLACLKNKGKQSKLLSI